jgi:hypothetical protein
MMLYIVIGGYRYESGAPIYGIFSTKEKADEVCKKNEGKAEYVDVYEYTLDEETDEQY